MPSQEHEVLVMLFRNRPELAPDLLREALGVELPEYTEARIDAADLTQVQPTEYRADLVVLLSNDKPVLGIVVEVQLSSNERKSYVWPAYVVNLRARLECPVCLLVVTPDEATARWASRVIDLGGPNRFSAFVLGPSGVPIVTDPTRAQADPELAVLSAMAHGQDADIERSAQIAIAALQAIPDLDAERSKLYFDLVHSALSEAARRALGNMDLAKYEYRSDIARQLLAQGHAQGHAQGSADMLVKLLTRRFGPLPEAARTQLAVASSEELDAIGERLLTAQSLGEALKGS